MGNLQAQTYLVGYTGSGASTSVDSVKVINLTQNTDLNMAGNDVLVLDVLVGMTENINTTANVIIYPNPFSSECYIEFYTGKSPVTIRVFDITGKEVVRSDIADADTYKRLALKNLHCGIYFVSIFSADIQYAGKIVSLYEGPEVPRIISYDGSVRQAQINGRSYQIADEKQQPDKAFSYVHMNYYAGDRLLLTGKSGNLRTIISIIPDHTQTLDFLFVPCTDADGNHYPVVHIGSQTWMAANLKTTHYRNGDSIPQLLSNTDWSNTMAGAYCNYNHSADSAAIYGRLYNWYALSDIRKLAPTGWRVASKDDMTALSTFLGDNAVAGGKMKETTLKHWNSPNAGASNASGFTALPGGNRSSYGNFNGIRNFIALWTSTFYPDGNSLAYYYHFSTISENLSLAYTDYNSGFSIRCVLGEMADVITDSITNVNSHSAMAYGRVTAQGTSPVTERGFCWSLTAHPTKANAWVACGSVTGSFSGNISGLMPDYYYHVRAYATNAVGTVYGNEITFLTPNGAPFFNLLPITNITPFSASSGGEIDTTGGFISDVHGVCWCLAPGLPYVYDSTSEDGSGTGTYVSQLTNLQPGKTYNVRAYSTNACGTVYGLYNGGNASFTAPATLPQLTTTNITGYTFPVATSGGNITYDGGAPITERGVCWSINYPPTIAGSHTSDGTGTGVFTSSISGPNQNTHYYVRAYATNSAGTAYGNVIDITPQLQLGQPYQGGVIAYFDLNSNNTTGLITSAVSSLGWAEWGCWNVWVNTSDNYGSGYGNTQNIVNACATPGIAARLCNDLVLNGYSDWYLPSLEELTKLHDARNTIGYIPAWYWSSSQTTNSGSAKGISFIVDQAGDAVKSAMGQVRPVRSF